jgi:hypothetical protein
MNDADYFFHLLVFDILGWISILGFLIYVVHLIKEK